MSGSPDPVAAMSSSADQPRAALRVRDVIALMVGVVVGVGIFRTPSLVAANADSGAFVMIVWLVGGIVSLAGALCYAELSATYPHAGGDYHYLSRAFGPRLSFLFAWARLSVLQTGSIAILGFVFGDYATQVLPMGPYSPALYAAGAVVLLTTVNVAGVRHSMRAQRLLTLLEIAGVLLVVFAGLVIAMPATAQDAIPRLPSASALGLMMVFVLLTYGGWNEAAYVSAEVREPRRNMARALVGGIAIVTVLYVLINLAYLRALGVHGMAASQAVAADVLDRAFGASGAWMVTLLVVVATLTSANATMITGARTAYALGRDVPLLSFLGHWHGPTGTPINALIVQGAVALALVAMGGATRRGFETMVEYTAPVFWSFFFLTGLSLFVLRRREAAMVRPFRVPLYPLTPLVFCATCAYLFYASLAYTGFGALVGLMVVGSGMVVLLVASPRPALVDRSPRAVDHPGSPS